MDSKQRNQSSQGIWRAWWNTETLLYTLGMIAAATVTVIDAVSFAVASADVTAS